MIAAEPSHAAGLRSDCGTTLAPMIRIYQTPDHHARCLSRDDTPPPEPFKLVASFEEEERERAWALLHELGGQPGAA